MKKYLKQFLESMVVISFLSMVVFGQSIQSSANKAINHNQQTTNEQLNMKKGGLKVMNYGSPSFDNASYYYAAIITPPASVWYRQAGLSPDGTKIVAQKSYTESSISKIEIVLMNADGTGETIISAGNSGTGDIYGYMNPFWSDDGTVIGFAEVHNTTSNKIVSYAISTSTTSYIYEPASGLDANNADFLGSSTTSIVFWDIVSGEADLFIWDGTTRTNITNSTGYKEYEPVSNGDGTKILYWSGETTAEPTNTTHTLTYSGGVWTKDVGFTPIVDSYWAYWSSRSNNRIGVTVMSTGDVRIYNSDGTFAFDLTGAGYSAGSGQWNFFGSQFEGPNGEIIITSNASRTDPGRDVVFAVPRNQLFVNVAFGNDLFPGTENAPFASIGKAITESVADGHVNVAAGTYTENVVVNKRITLSGADAGTTIIVATNANSYPLTFSSSGATVSGFTLTHNYTPSELSSWTFNNNGVTFSGASNTGNTLTHCIITLNRNGIYINNSQNNIITDNIITDNRTGINMCGNMNGTVITNNTFSDNWTEGIVTYGNSTMGIDYSSITVTGNTFSNNWYSDILIKDAPAYTGTLDVTDNTYIDSPVTYSLSTNSSLNEPAFADLKPVSLGGTAVPPTTVIPTLRIYNSGSVGLGYNGTKTVLVDGGTTIQASINVAAAGDIILVGAGTYSENININKSLTVNSAAGSASTTITGTSGTPTVTVGANNIIVSGFTISNPGGHCGIYAQDRNGINIRNNIITNIGPSDATSSTSNSGIAIICTSSDITDITIENNNINNIQGGNYTSANGIAVGWSSGNNLITDLLIQNNLIADIASATAAWPIGRGAYGILINHGTGTTGRTISPAVLNNTISNLEGLWAHGIGLEGNTPNALVQYNSINNLIDHKSPADSDAVAVMVEDNASANTVAINNNSFTNVLRGIRNATTLNVDGTQNYWGTILESKIRKKINNPEYVDYNPWIGKTTSPALNQTGVTIWTYQITWQAFGSGHYDFMLYKNGTMGGGGTQVGSTQSNISTAYAAISAPLEYETEYYWYIRDHSLTEWDELHFTTASSSSAYLVTPADGSTIYGTTIYFNWLSFVSGVEFDLQIDDDPLFGSPTTLASDLSVVNYTYDASSLIPGQIYKWRVITKTPADSITGTSSIWSFTMPGLAVPTAYYPAGNAIAFINPPTLYWSSTSYIPSNTYNIRYWKDGQTPPTSTTAQTNLTGYFNTGSADLYTTLTEALDAGATYHWEVALVNGTNTSSWSSPTADFIVYSSVPSTPPVPVPSYPTGGATSYLNPPMLYWYLGTYATGLQFNIEWDDDSNMDESPLGESGWITDYYYTMPSGIPAGTIYWRIRSRIGSGGSPSSWSSVVNFVLPSPSGSVPVPSLIYPIGGTTVYSLSQYLYWFAYSTSTLEYQVNVSANPDVDENGVLINGNTIYPGSGTYTTDLYYALSGLSSGTTYYWQARARVAGSPGTESSWSSVTNFTTAAGSFAIVPLIGSPSHGMPINSTSAVLTWIIPTQSESPLTYEVEFSKNKDMSNAVSMDCENKPFAEINGLDSKSTYYWRVKSKTKNGSISNYSAVGSFKTDNSITDVNEAEIPAEFSLMQNYPNPFNPTTRISYSLPKNSLVTIKIYDMLGREVKTLVNNEVNAGNNFVVWNGDDNFGNKVVSGTYIYRITADNFVSAKKMILIK